MRVLEYCKARKVGDRYDILHEMGCLSAFFLPRLRLGEQKQLQHRAVVPLRVSGCERICDVSARFHIRSNFPSGAVSVRADGLFAATPRWRSIRRLRAKLAPSCSYLTSFFSGVLGLLECGSDVALIYCFFPPPRGIIILLRCVA